MKDLFRRHRHAWLTAVPVVLVNVVAFQAQLAFWGAHLPQSQAVLVSLALESIAVYLAWQAYLALIANDSALRLRLAAYGMALVIGVLNYSHYMLPGWRPTVAAVTFGMMSAISPWLWAVHSRRVSRDQLKALNRIDDPAVKLGFNRWLWHPFKSWAVQRRAAWVAAAEPAEAILLPKTPKLDAMTELQTPDPGRGANAATHDLPPREGPVPSQVKLAPPQTPPSVPRAGEPLPEAAADDSAAPAEGLTAARDEFERELARDLIRLGHPLPGRNALARAPGFSHLGSPSTRRRSAARILADARAGLNGNHDGS